MSPAEIKFIIKFLVCLVLKNFQTEQVLSPEIGKIEIPKSLSARLMEENAFLASTYAVMSNKEYKRNNEDYLTLYDKQRLLKMGIG